MKTLCKHEPHRIIDNIFEPKYSTKEVLINVNQIRRSVEHYLLKFTKCDSMKGWYYFSLRDIEKCKRQKNGAGTMLLLPLGKLEDFEPDNKCNH